MQYYFHANCSANFQQTFSTLNASSNLRWNCDFYTLNVSVFSQGKQVLHTAWTIGIKSGNSYDSPNKGSYFVERTEMKNQLLNADGFEQETAVGLSTADVTFSLQCVLATEQETEKTEGFFRYGGQKKKTNEKEQKLLTNSYSQSLRGQVTTRWEPPNSYEQKKITLACNTCFLCL